MKNYKAVTATGRKIGFWIGAVAFTALAALIISLIVAGIVFLWRYISNGN